MKAVVFSDKEGLRLDNNYPKPVLKEGEALIKVIMAGICNTDFEITKGYMGYNGVLGHEFIGIVEEVNGDDKFLIGKPFTLACIEIMNFKNINGMVGIQAGDLILKKASGFFKGCITYEDRLYRMTGVTFMIVFDENSDVETSLKKIMELEKKQVDFVYSKDPENSVQEEQTVCYKLAIGISKFPDDAKDFTTIIRHVDIALAHAQNQTENKVITYNEELEKEQQKQAEADRLITESLEKDWFYLMYQPQFTLEEKKLRGFETLIRCKKPDGSIVSPAFFIPAAEKSNLILKISFQILV